MKNQLKAVRVTLQDSIFKNRMDVNRRFMMDFEPRRLLANYFYEAGLNSNIHYDTMPQHYGGWEEPDQQVRGSYAGHYMSACAMLYYFEGDEEMKRRGDAMVDCLEECQKEGEDHWVGSIPPVYLERIARNKWVWAPHYMIHKTFMGLIDMYRFAGNKKALEIADRWADWFVNWTDKFDEEQLARLMDWESGGLMECWAQLYGMTGEEKYRKLIGRYYRRNLFDPLIRGGDALTLKHANTSIPEAHGCARAYEVTGEEKYKKAVEMFWHFAVEARDSYASGGQNNRELWVKDLTENLTDSTQEFCTVYNMIRLADDLLRWTGEKKYGDYIEKCYYNGVLAQQNKRTGEACYFLPMSAGAKKKWLEKYHTFYCCCGTMLQAQSSYGDKLLYRDDEAFYISQYIPFSASTQQADISMEFGYALCEEKANEFYYLIKAEQKRPGPLRFCLRKPDWTEDYRVSVNGVDVCAKERDGWIQINDIQGERSEIRLQVFPHIIPVRLGAKDSRTAFRFGPVLMAALSDSEYFLHGTLEEIVGRIDTENMVFADLMERDSTYVEDPRCNFKFLPLYRIVDETYQVYFPIIGQEDKKQEAE